MCKYYRKPNIPGVQHYPWFQASTGGLGTYSPLIRVENGSRSCLYSYYCSATKCSLQTFGYQFVMEHTKKLKEIRIVKHFDSMSGIFLKLASFLSFFFLLVTRFYCILKSIGLGQIRSFEKWFLNTDILSNTVL